MPRRIALLAATLGVLVAGTARAGEEVDRGGVRLDRPIVVLTAAEPLDAERLADALRTYLDEFSVDVRTAEAAPRGDLRSELATNAGIGAAVKAWAVVRIADGAPGTAEIEVVDRVTTKSLVTSVPRPRRDEDLYRAVALKVQALLRASLAEQSPGVASSPSLTRLSASVAPRAGEDRRFALETSFTVVGFSSNGILQQGVSVAVSGRLWQQRLELVLGVQALSGIDARAGAVSASVDRVPLFVVARLVKRSGRWEVAAGAVAEAAFVSLRPTSATLAVRSGWSLVPAAGGQAGARLHLGERTWIGMRVTALGVLIGQHFTAQGQPLLSLSGLEVVGEGGVGVDLW
jgi:hypothetical protein